MRGRGLSQYAVSFRTPDYKTLRIDSENMQKEWLLLYKNQLVTQMPDKGLEEELTDAARQHLDKMYVLGEKIHTAAHDYLTQPWQIKSKKLINRQEELVKKLERITHLQMENGAQANLLRAMPQPPFDYLDQIMSYSRKSDQLEGARLALQKEMEKTNKDLAPAWKKGYQHVLGKIRNFGTNAKLDVRADDEGLKKDLIQSLEMFPRDWVSRISGKTLHLARSNRLAEGELGVYMPANDRFPAHIAIDHVCPHSAAVLAHEMAHHISANHAPLRLACWAYIIAHPNKQRSDHYIYKTYATDTGGFIPETELFSVSTAAMEGSDYQGFGSWFEDEKDRNYYLAMLSSVK